MCYLLSLANVCLGVWITLSTCYTKNVLLQHQPATTNLQFIPHITHFSKTNFYWHHYSDFKHYLNNPCSKCHKFFTTGLVAFFQSLVLARLLYSLVKQGCHQLFFFTTTNVKSLEKKHTGYSGWHSVMVRVKVDTLSSDHNMPNHWYSCIQTSY